MRRRGRQALAAFRDQRAGESFIGRSPCRFSAVARCLHLSFAGIACGGIVPIDINSHLGVLPQALQLQSRRTEVLAANLANADTPNFKARDLDFRAALAAAGAPGATLKLDGTHARHLATAGAGGNDDVSLQYRTPLAPSLDGNTVDSHLEQAAFAENAVRYQATLTFLNAKFRSLLTAITGQ
jgi:flagellar basal-body rod protein FlgB